MLDCVIERFPFSGSEDVCVFGCQEPRRAWGDTCWRRVTTTWRWPSPCFWTAEESRRSRAPAPVQPQLRGADAIQSERSFKPGGVGVTLFVFT